MSEETKKSVGRKAETANLKGFVRSVSRSDGERDKARKVRYEKTFVLDMMGKDKDEGAFVHYRVFVNTRRPLCLDFARDVAVRVFLRNEMPPRQEGGTAIRLATAIRVEQPLLTANNRKGGLPPRDKVSYVRLNARVDGVRTRYSREKGVFATFIEAWIPEEKKAVTMRAFTKAPIYVPAGASIRCFGFFEKDRQEQEVFTLARLDMVCFDMDAEAQDGTRQKGSPVQVPAENPGQEDLEGIDDLQFRF
jgi:hypothetical protein